jgi:hypothetical protein
LAVRYTISYSKEMEVVRTQFVMTSNQHLSYRYQLLNTTVAYRGEYSTSPRQWRTEGGGVQEFKPPRNSEVLQKLSRIPSSVEYTSVTYSQYGFHPFANRVEPLTRGLPPPDLRSLCPLLQRFPNFFQVGTTYISQNVLRTTFISQNVLRTTLLLSPF